jgi:transcription elongation factor Elf1
VNTHSFLKNLLLSTNHNDQQYQEADKTSKDAAHQLDHGTEDEESQVAETESSYGYDSGEPSTVNKWTDEYLPQIQRARSGRTNAEQGKKLSVTAIPEPQVIYSSFVTDTSVKRPTRDAVEEVLKEVYNKDKEEQTSLGDQASNSRFVQQADNVGEDGAEMTNTDSEPADSRDHTMFSKLFQNKAECPDSDIGQVKDSVHNTFLVENNHVDPRTAAENTNGNLTEHDRDIVHRQKKVSSTLAKKIQTKTGSKSKKQAQTELGDDETDQQGDRGTEQATARKGRRNRNDTETSGDSVSIKTVDTSEEFPNRRTSSRLPKKSKLIGAVRESTDDRGVKTVENTKLKIEKNETRVENFKSKERRDNSEYTLHCEQCDYVAKKKEHLRKHKRRVHITKTFKCLHCGKEFGFGNDLNRHMHTHLKAENCCDLCGKIYKNVRTLAEHRKTHEDNYTRPEWACKFCEKTFSTKYVLAYHIKSEHLGLKKTFICPICGKSFSQKVTYLKHANVHMGIKPYRCDVCNKSFSYEKSLREHK